MDIWKGGRWSCIGMVPEAALLGYAASERQKKFSAQKSPCCLARASV
ncbi:hypothetical protein MUB18_05050 [Sphingobacterium sp. PCS056]|nr:hypothetical protein [Sphingobacterium sp. PCS056]UPZ37671.1 hypothetical protein MUB18_05050 [Sphingobacterium sp. PCS056]